MLEVVGSMQLLACALRVVSVRNDAFSARRATKLLHEWGSAMKATLCEHFPRGHVSHRRRVSSGLRKCSCFCG